LVKDKTIGIDATTLEANAALKSIVRRDTGEGYEEFLARLAKASGIGTPTRTDSARLDRRRKKKGSNNEWTHPHDPDAKITKMKDGRTHLAHKAEHAIDLETGAIVGVTVQGADQGDTTTIQQTLPEAAEQLEAVAAVTDDAVKVIEEVVADKGYHSRTTIHDLETLEIRTYISEPDRGSQSWIDQRAECDAVYANRRRIHGARGKRLLRRRGELLERPCAHLHETGGLRRANLRGHENVLKRLLVHASAFNLGLWMRSLFGVGTPRTLQGRPVPLGALLGTLWTLVYEAIAPIWNCDASQHQSRSRRLFVSRVRENATCTTGCSRGSHVGDSLRFMHDLAARIANRPIQLTTDGLRVWNHQRHRGAGRNGRHVHYLGVLVSSGRNVRRSRHLSIPAAGWLATEKAKLTDYRIL
jgi:transposase